MELSKIKNEIEVYKNKAILSVLYSILNEQMSIEGLIGMYRTRQYELLNINSHKAERA
jgi:hypothetical protein